MNTRKTSQKRKAEEVAPPAGPAAKSIKGTPTTETQAEEDLSPLKTNAVPIETQKKTMEEHPSEVADGSRDSEEPASSKANATEMSVEENKEAETEAISERPKASKRPKEAISKRPKKSVNENMANKPKAIEGEKNPDTPDFSFVRI